MTNEIKKGTFRWRRKFRHLPDRETLINEIGMEWLANRLWTIIYRHIYDQYETIELMRVNWHEFTFIIHKMHNMYNIEIIQKEQKNDMELLQSNNCES